LKPILDKNSFDAFDEVDHVIPTAILSDSVPWPKWNAELFKGAQIRFF
jgi:hypothetical protein